MYEYEHNCTGFRMKAKVKWKTPPWGAGRFSNTDDPERYAIHYEFEKNANSMSLEAFKKKWDIVELDQLVVGVPGFDRMTGLPPPYPTYLYGDGNM